MSDPKSQNSTADTSALVLFDLQQQIVRLDLANDPVCDHFFHPVGQIFQLIPENATSNIQVPLATGIQTVSRSIEMIGSYREQRTIATVESRKSNRVKSYQLANDYIDKIERAFYAGRDRSSFIGALESEKAAVGRHYSIVEPSLLNAGHLHLLRQKPAHNEILEFYSRIFPTNELVYGLVKEMKRLRNAMSHSNLPEGYSLLHQIKVDRAFILHADVDASDDFKNLCKQILEVVETMAIQQVMKINVY